MTRLAELFRSDYWWDTVYELVLAALIVGAGVVLTAFGEVTNVEQLESLEWWQGVGISALVAMVNFLRSRLPPRHPPDEGDRVVS